MKIRKTPLSLALLFCGFWPLWADVVPSWIARYNGARNHNDRGTALGLDQMGNVYVAGSSVTADGIRRCTTIKYGRDGRGLWIADKNPGYANAIAVATNSD